MNYSKELCAAALFCYATEGRYALATTAKRLYDAISITSEDEKSSVCFTSEMVYSTMQRDWKQNANDFIDLYRKEVDPSFKIDRRLRATTKLLRVAQKVLGLHG